MKAQFFLKKGSMKRWQKIWLFWRYVIAALAYPKNGKDCENIVGDTFILGSMGGWGKSRYLVLYN